MLTIKQRQQNLYTINYYFGRIDGIEGKKTKASYLSFQKANSLKEDGIYGSETNAKLGQAIKDIQVKLNNKNVEKILVDGMVGINTINAIKAFQRANGLSMDGIVGVNTLRVLNGESSKGAATNDVSKVDWSTVKYFTKDEFKCGCNGKYCSGYPAEIDRDLINVLERARIKFGKPIRITSGVRCSRHNSSLSGSSSTSRHMYGKAADVWIVGTSGNNYTLRNWFRSQSEVNYTYTGFGAVHVDVK